MKFLAFLLIATSVYGSAGLGPELKIFEKALVKPVNAFETELSTGTLGVINDKNKEHVVKMKNVSFTSTSAVFTVTQLKDRVELDVHCGEVTFSSPLIMTFVPEIIKAKTGFTFLAKEKKIQRRKFNGMNWKVKCPKKG